MYPPATRPRPWDEAPGFLASVQDAPAARTPATIVENFMMAKTEGPERVSLNATLPHCVVQEFQHSR